MKKAFKIVMVLILCLAFLPGCYKVSKGVRSGELVKFSQKGIMYESGEGDLVMNVFNMKSQSRSKTGTQSGNVFHFSVDTDNPKYKEICDKLTSFMGKMVDIHYTEEWIVSPFRADTTYLVTDVKLATGN